MPNHEPIRAVAFEEGDVWVVQGVEFDIAAQAADLKLVPLAFVRALVETLCIAKERGLDPLSALKPAPNRFREMFERAEYALSTVKDADLGPLPRKKVEVRMADESATA